MPKERRGRILWWVNRAGRWSFLDVFFVVALCAGLGTSLGGVDLAIETMWSIYAFGIATIWARFLGVYVEAGHRACAGDDVEGARLACRCVGALSEKRLELMLGVASFVLFTVCVIACTGPYLKFLVKEVRLGVETAQVYSIMGLGVRTSEDDRAGAKSLFLLVIPYLMWGILMSLICPAMMLTALVLGKLGLRGKRLIIGMADMAGSAASTDVLLFATALASGHFGDLVEAALRCLGAGIADNVKASSSLGWAFYVLLLAVPAQWVMQETALALHDKTLERQMVAAEPHKDVEAQSAGKSVAEPTAEAREENPDITTAHGEETTGAPPNDASAKTDSVSVDNSQLDHSTGSPPNDTAGTSVNPLADALGKESNAKGHHAMKLAL